MSLGSTVQLSRPAICASVPACEHRFGGEASLAMQRSDDLFTTNSLGPVLS